MFVSLYPVLCFSLSGYQNLFVFSILLCSTTLCRCVVFYHGFCLRYSHIISGLLLIVSLLVVLTLSLIIMKISSANITWLNIYLQPPGLASMNSVRKIVSGIYYTSFSMRILTYVIVKMYRYVI